MSGRKAISMTGRRVGRLLVGERVGTGVKQKSALWQCVCDCGRTLVVSAAALVKSSSARDCGCGAKTVATTVPGAARRPEYPCWSAMWTRCTWSGHRNWADYGGRGIRVCDRWRDFAAFLADVGPRPSPKHSLDRFPNVDGNYEPGNVRWATQAEQARNQRRAVFVDLGGGPVGIDTAAARLGIDPGTVRSRLRRGLLKKFNSGCGTESRDGAPAARVAGAEPQTAEGLS